jgi:hypothetical protein
LLAALALGAALLADLALDLAGVLGLVSLVTMKKFLQIEVMGMAPAGRNTPGLMYKWPWPVCRGGVLKRPPSPRVYAVIRLS